MLNKAGLLGCQCARISGKIGVRISGARTADLIATLAELDRRALYLSEGCTSLYVHCRHVLRLSEHSSYHCIEAAHVARRFPVVLERLREGAITGSEIPGAAPPS